METINAAFTFKISMTDKDLGHKAYFEILSILFK